MNLSKRIALLVIIAFSSALYAMEIPQGKRAESETITLESDPGNEFFGKRFEVPLEVAQKSRLIAERIKDLEYQKEQAAKQGYGIESKVKLHNVSKEVLAEIAQLMELMDQNKNLTEEQLLNKAVKEIPIQDNFAFAATVEYLSFKPGLDLISKKYAQSSDYSLPKNEYNYWMNLIQEIDPEAYALLKACETENKKPCIEIQIDQWEPIKRGVKTTHGYPTLLINPALKFKSEYERKSTLKGILDWYSKDRKRYESEEKFAAGSNEELPYIMDLIKGLAPELYKLIIAVDPTGAGHIKRKYAETTAAVAPSFKDGLPEIDIGLELQKLPKNEARFTLAHELSHYVLGHFQPPTVAHKELQKTEAPALTHEALQKVAMEEFKKGKKAYKPFKVSPSKQLVFEESFKKAFSRTQELEADRFAVIEFGVPIDDAIARAKRGATEAEEQKMKTPEKETFTITHPLWMARIKQLEDLRREIELHKVQKRQPKQIPWKELAENYLKDYKTRLPELYAAQAPSVIQPSITESEIILTSADGKTFIVPKEIALQSSTIQSFAKYGNQISLPDMISGQTLAEIAQLMQALDQHKDLSEDQFFALFENKINIQDNYAFLMAVKDLQFKPGLTFISQKYAQLGDYSFPKAEYDYWMKFIQGINPEAYGVLKKCEAANKKPCLEMAVDEGLVPIEPPTEETHGYPILLIDPAMKLWSEEGKKGFLKSLLDGYLEMYNIK